MRGAADKRHTMDGALSLWLVRHGQTEANATGRLAGWTDTPLTSEGRAQARAIGAFLAGRSFDGVWSSDLIRAVETARLAWGEPAPDARLREMDFGELEGQPWDGIDAPYRDGLLEYRGFESPGGEDVAALRSRLLDFVGSLAPGRHLIFTHGGSIRLLTMELGLDRFVANGALVVIDWTARRLDLVRELGKG